MNVLLLSDEAISFPAPHLPPEKAFRNILDLFGISLCFSVSSAPSDSGQSILFFLNVRLYSFCPKRMEKTFPNKEVLLECVWPRQQ